MVTGGDESDDVPSLPSKKRRLEDSESEDTCKDHVKAMKHELARSSNRTLAMINLMGLTHP